jgi:hypothetical protein
MSVPRISRLYPSPPGNIPDTHFSYRLSQLLGICIVSAVFLYCFVYVIYSYFSIIGPTRRTICFQFITINSLYMFRALIFLLHISMHGK